MFIAPCALTLRSERALLPAGGAYKPLAPTEQKTFLTDNSACS